MLERIKESTTDSYGQVYLLVETPYDWRIISAAKLGNGGKSRRIYALGDRVFVEDQWEIFVENQKRAIATNYEAFVRRSLRQIV